MAQSRKQEEQDNRKVAIYARKSKITESGKSVENQITKCRSYADLKFDAQAENILVYQDEGLSGYYSDRPQYMQMLQDIRDNKIKAVICYKFDRISRRTLDLLNLVEQLKVKKKPLFIPFSQTPSLISPTLSSQSLRRIRLSR